MGALESTCAYADCYGAEFSSEHATLIDEGLGRTRGSLCLGGNLLEPALLRMPSERHVASWVPDRNLDRPNHSPEATQPRVGSLTLGLVQYLLRSTRERCGAESYAELGGIRTLVAETG